MTSFSPIKKLNIEYTVFLKELTEITAKIRVHLNLNGHLDNEILSIIKKINDSCEKAYIEKLL